MKKKPIAVMLCLLGVVGIYGFSQAGDLEPPGPPAPTMVTLGEIDAKLDALVASSIMVSKSGQTTCWNAGTPVACAGTGQDGEYQMGVSIDPRFTDNGDGTVRDNLTGLIWLKDANCFGQRDWADALSDANTLASGSCGLTDGSVAGDWRLPNVKEFQSIAAFSQVDPALPVGHPFSGVQFTATTYWTSTTHNFDPDFAFVQQFHAGIISVFRKVGEPQFVWLVRGRR